MICFLCIFLFNLQPWKTQACLNIPRIIRLVLLNPKSHTLTHSQDTRPALLCSCLVGSWSGHSFTHEIRGLTALVWRCPPKVKSWKLHPQGKSAERWGLLDKNMNVGPFSLISTHTFLPTFLPPWDDTWDDPYQTEVPRLWTSHLPDLQQVNLCSV